MELQNRLLLTNQTYYEKLVEIVICSGIGPNILKKYKPALEKHFSDFFTVAGYTETDCFNIYRDESMLHNMGKIEACVYNAREIAMICGTYGSMEMYFSGFDSLDPQERLLKMSKDLMSRFKYLGEKNVLTFIKAIHAEQSKTVDALPLQEMVG
ncbi:MAG TPA: DNA-3-methyladenine glycosylase I [Fusibacter sp.]|nr:DNA-3-methyladenine glycosylase I [Fusibacter sp.]